MYFFTFSFEKDAVFYLLFIVLLNPDSKTLKLNSFNAIKMRHLLIFQCGDMHPHCILLSVSLESYQLQKAFLIKFWGLIFFLCWTFRLMIALINDGISWNGLRRVRCDVSVHWHVKLANQKICLSFSFSFFFFFSSICCLLVVVFRCCCCFYLFRFQSQRIVTKTNSFTKKVVYHCGDSIR